MFAHPILRKYAEGLEKYAFSTGVSQSEALARRLRDDDELMLECRETLDAELDAGGEEWILDINPPRHGFFLSSLYTGMNVPGRPMLLLQLSLIREIGSAKQTVQLQPKYENVYQAARHIDAMYIVSH
jgi:hypothetical protein